MAFVVGDTFGSLTGKQHGGDDIGLSGTDGELNQVYGDAFRGITDNARGG